MKYGKVNRRGFLKRVAAVVVGLALVPAFAAPAQARWPHHRGWGGGGYRGYGWGMRRPFYGGFPGYGYGGYAPGFYYSRGYYGGGLPYGGGFYSPVVPATPYYNFYNFGVPIL